MAQTKSEQQRELSQQMVNPRRYFKEGSAREINFTDNEASMKTTENQEARNCSGG
jgi:hypothetical protein